MNNLKYLLIILLMGFFRTGNGQVIINDANAVQREVDPFAGIKVSGGIDVYLSQGDDYALAVSANESKYRENIQTKIINGILFIYYDRGAISFNEKRNLRVYLSFKTLESIEASGACNIIINKTMKSSDLKLKFSGASEMRGTLKSSNVSLKMSGASTIKIDGKIENLRVEASGASDMKNFDLVADNCIIKLSGASDMRLTVNNSLSVNASGASELIYKGNPINKDTNVSGASSVSSAN
jgi:hypothetical protein